MNDFFEPPPPPPGPQSVAWAGPAQNRFGPPARTVPAVVPTERLIAQTDEATICLSHFWVYPTGLEFKVVVDADDDWSDLDPFDQERRRRGPASADAPPDRLLFGFEFADGSKVTTLEMGPGWAGADADSPMLLHRSGSSGGGHWTEKYWLRGLPPPGQLSFVCQWRAAGVPLTRVDLDAGNITEAAARAQTIFPDHKRVAQ